MKRAIVVVVILAAAGAAGWFYYFRRGAPEIGAQTSPITRGDIVDAVSTTGTLQASASLTIPGEPSRMLARTTQSAAVDYAHGMGRTPDVSPAARP